MKYQRSVFFKNEARPSRKGTARRGSRARSTARPRRPRGRKSGARASAVWTARSRADGGARAQAATAPVKSPSLESETEIRQLLAKAEKKRCAKCLARESHTEKTHARISERERLQHRTNRGIERESARARRKKEGEKKRDSSMIDTTTPGGPACAAGASGPMRSATAQEGGVCLRSRDGHARLRIALATRISPSLKDPSWKRSRLPTYSREHGPCISGTLPIVTKPRDQSPPTLKNPT